MAHQQHAAVAGEGAAGKIGHDFSRAEVLKEQRLVSTVVAEEVVQCGFIWLNRIKPLDAFAASLFNLSVKYPTTTHPMTFEDFIPRLLGSTTFVANAIVGIAAFQFYLKGGMRSVLFVAISGGLGAMLSVISWAAETSSSTFWTVIDVLYVFDLVFWAVAMCLLFRDLARNKPAA